MESYFILKFAFTVISLPQPLYAQIFLLVKHNKQQQLVHRPMLYFVWMMAYIITLI